MSIKKKGLINIKLKAVKPNNDTQYVSILERCSTFEEMVKKNGVNKAGSVLLKYWYKISKSFAIEFYKSGLSYDDKLIDRACFRCGVNVCSLYISPKKNIQVSMYLIDYVKHYKNFDQLLGLHVDLADFIFEYYRDDGVYLIEKLIYDRI